MTSDCLFVFVIFRRFTSEIHFYNSGEKIHKDCIEKGFVWTILCDISSCNLLFIDTQSVSFYTKARPLQKPYFSSLFNHLNETNYIFNIFSVPCWLFVILTSISDGRGGCHV